MNNDQPQIRIYLDTGASVKGFKEFHNRCRFIVSPYDHESGRRNDVKWELGIHSEVQWSDCNWPWKDDTQSWKGKGPGKGPKERGRAWIRHNSNQMMLKMLRDDL